MASFRYDDEEARLTVRTDSAEVVVQALAQDLFHVRMVVFAAEARRRGSHGLPFPAVSQKEWPAKRAGFSETSDALRLATGRAAIEISRSPVRLAFYDSAGDLLNRDGREKGMGWNRHAVVCSKELLTDEHFYGFGEHTGFLDRRGLRMTMWNTDACPHTPATDQMYQSIPFFISVRPGKSGKPGKAYGVFFANSHRSYFDMGKERADRYEFGEDGGDLEYYFFAGPDPKAILARYTELTGRMELPPKWALGYHQSRYSYASADEVLEVAREFRGRGIPCDAIYLDIDYMDGYRVFTWDRERFPRPKALLAELAGQGFRVVPIIDPGVKVDPEYRTYREGSERGHFCIRPDGSEFRGKVWAGESAFPDFAQAKVREWWGECHQQLLDAGVAGIWNDMNEPSVFDGPEKTMPLDAMHGEAGGTEAPHAAIHNLYGLYMCQATHEALRAARPEERPFVLTRAGFAGIQRYAAVWTGDNSSWWEHLAASMPMCLNMGMSGVPFVGADVGGFLGDGDDELLVRWIQLGAFLPFFRNHSEIWSRAQEPWAFGKRCEDIAARYIRLRYQFMPYLYNAFREAALSGVPVARPMALEFPDDEAALRVWDQFLVGGDLLVAPVYLPAATHRVVYLPKGEWIHLGAKTLYRGPAHVLVEAPLEELPLFVRAGAIIPMEPPLNHAGERPADQLILDVYPARAETPSKTTLRHYEDDGSSTRYKSGDSCVTEFTCEVAEATEAPRAVEAARAVGVAWAGRSVTFHIGEKSGPFRAPHRAYLIRFTLPEKADYSVKVDGVPLLVAGAASPEPSRYEESAIERPRAWYETKDAVLCVRIPDSGRPVTIALEP